MSTSGTVSTTSIDVDTLLSHAIRRCGVSSSEVTAEHAQIAKEVLYFYLSNLVNHGVQLWTISRDIFGLVAYTNQITLPIGTEGVLNANKRTIVQMTGAYASSAGGTADNAFDKDADTACVQTSANGNISLTLGSAAVCTTVGFMAYGNLSLTPVFEYTTDGSTWQTLFTPTPDAGAATISVTDGQWKWWDIPAMKSAIGYRMRETGGATLALRELFFGNTPQEVPMSRLNRDDYNNLPNKTLVNTPLQFYFDRQRLQPILNLWPTPNSSFEQVVVFRHRQIQDVGSLTNEIEVPQRWQNAIMKNLAAQLIYELPGADLNRAQLLQVQADQATFEAEQEERDNSPIYLYPSIAVYTR